MQTRGSLRAYRVQETATRGPHLELVQAFEVTDVIDAASTQHETPMTDWPALEAEMDRRVCKELAIEIAKIVERDAGEGWSFAAPESIHRKIVEQLPPEIRERIVEACRVRSGQIASSSVPVALSLASADLNCHCALNKDEIKPKRNVRKEQRLMAKCEHCGNDYDKTFEIRFKDKTHVFDSFECAIHVIAPECDHCRCKIIGHGVENGSRIFCCANCARESGENRLRDRV